MLKNGSTVEITNSDDSIEVVVFCGKGVRKNNTILVVDSSGAKRLVNISRIITIDGVSPNVANTPSNANASQGVTECDRQISNLMYNYIRSGNSLATVMSAISLILWEKGDHLQRAWQDYYQAKQYKRVGAYFTNLAYKIQNDYEIAHDVDDWGELELLVDHYGLSKVVRSIAGGLPSRECKLIESVLLKIKGEL